MQRPAPSLPCVKAQACSLLKGLCKSAKSCRHLPMSCWPWMPHKTGINPGATPTGGRDVYLVGIDYPTYRDLVVTIKEQHRAVAAATGLMIRHNRHRSIHSERVVLTPQEAINRALPWCRNGKPLEGRLQARAYVDPGANKLRESSPPTATRALPAIRGRPCMPWISGTSRMLRALCAGVGGLTGYPGCLDQGYQQRRLTNPR